MNIKLRNLIVDSFNLFVLSLGCVLLFSMFFMVWILNMNY